MADGGDEVPVDAEPLIDAERLRAGVLQTRAGLEANPDGGVIRPWVETRLIHDVSAESRFEQFGREFTLRSDEPAGRGGQGDHPTAIRYFLSGIGFCLQVWYAKSAALLGCELTDVTLRLTATLDMRVEYGLEPTGEAESLLAEVDVTSPSAPAVVQAMVAEAHRRCPLSNLVERSVPIQVRLRHNGTVIFRHGERSVIGGG